MLLDKIDELRKDFTTTRHQKVFSKQDWDLINRFASQERTKTEYFDQLNRLFNDIEKPKNWLFITEFLHFAIGRIPDKP